MREIKFRAWDKEIKQVVYYPMFKFNGNTVDINEQFKCVQNGDEYILMQYTGLKDKNGKEIYEGDIVKYTRNNQIITASIEWREGEGCYHYHNIEDSVDSDSLVKESMFFIGSETVEIIGNIYENPELLK